MYKYFRNLGEINLRKTVILLFMLIIFLFSCVTTKDNKAEKSDDIELWLLKAQDLTNRGKYKDAIILLNEAMIKFPDIEVLALNYNIGYNYYKLRNIDDSVKYLNRVISIFENSQFTPDDINENRKYTILAGVVLERIEKDKADRRDPYHIQDDLKEKRRVRPKKNTEEPEN